MEKGKQTFNPRHPIAALYQIWLKLAHMQWYCGRRWKCGRFMINRSKLIRWKCGRFVINTSRQIRWKCGRFVINRQLISICGEIIMLHVKWVMLHVDKNKSHFDMLTKFILHVGGRSKPLIGSNVNLFSLARLLI